MLCYYSGLAHAGPHKYSLKHVLSFHYLWSSGCIAKSECRQTKFPDVPSFLAFEPSQICSKMLLNIDHRRGSSQEAVHSLVVSNTSCLEPTSLEPSKTTRCSNFALAAGDAQYMRNEVAWDERPLLEYMLWRSPNRECRVMQNVD